MSYRCWKVQLLQGCQGAFETSSLALVVKMFFSEKREQLSLPPNHNIIKTKCYYYIIVYDTLKEAIYKHGPTIPSILSDHWSILGIPFKGVPE